VWSGDTEVNLIMNLEIDPPEEVIIGFRWGNLHTFHMQEFSSVNSEIWELIFQRSD